MAIQGLKALSAPRTSIRFRQDEELLARYLRPQGRLVAAVAALLFAGIGLQLLGPQIIRYFIDEAVAGGPARRGRKTP